MAETILNKLIMFNDGFIIESLNQLNYGSTYYLTIDGTVINKPYTIINTNNVITDKWTSVGYTPPNGTVCFTLADNTSGCPPITCTLTVW